MALKRLAWLLAVMGLWGCGGESDAPARLVAASSMAPAAPELERMLAARSLATQIELGSTSRLVRQLEAGAPADALITANAEWMDHAIQSGLVEESRVVELASGSLVLALTSARPVTSIDELEGRIALGAETIPLGSYTDAALRSLAPGGLRAQIVRAPSARATLAWLMASEVDAAIVYASDAQSAGVHVAMNISRDSHPPIRYLAAPLSERGQAIVDALSDDALPILMRHGMEAP